MNIYTHLSTIAVGDAHCTRNHYRAYNKGDEAGLYPRESQGRWQHTESERCDERSPEGGTHYELTFHFKHLIIMGLVTQEASIISMGPNSEKARGLTPVCVISKFYHHFSKLGYVPGKKRKPSFNLTFFSGKYLKSRCWSWKFLPHLPS